MEENKIEGTKKNNKKSIIIASVIGVIILGGVIAFLIWYNSPFQVIKRAIQKNDIETVSENFYKLEDPEDRKYVKKEMKRFIKAQNDLFVEGTLDYETFSYYLVSLGEEVLKTDDDFELIKNNAEILIESRMNFQTATELFNAGDYSGAIEYYQLVNEIDSNYETAKEQFVLSKEKQLVGSWKISGDVGPLMAEGSEYFYGCSYPVDLYIIFNDDGTGKLDIDSNVISDYEFDKFWSKFADNKYYDDYMECLKAGYFLDDYIKAFGYDEYEDWLRGDGEMETKIKGVIDDMCDNIRDMEFTYYYEDSLVITFESGSDSCIKYTYSIDDETNKLNIASHTEGDMFNLLSVKVPCSLARVEE